MNNDTKKRTKTHACDCVSRQAAITAIQKAYVDTEGGTDKCAVWKNVGLTNALHIMQDLPSAQSEPCDDAVSRKAAIKCCTFGRTSLGLIDELRRLPSVTPEQRWIPCNDRLPEDGERVLATHLGGLNPDRQVIEHIYKNGEFTLGWDMDMNKDSPTFGQRYMGKVVAWMPIPEPYTEKQEE